MTIEEAIGLYTTHLESAGRATGTRKSNREWLGSFLEFCHGRGVHDLHALTAELLAAYRQHVTWTPGKKGALYSQNTLFQAQRMVRAFLSWLFGKELLWHDLSQGWVLRRPPDPPRDVPTVTEVSRLLSTPDLATAVGLRNRVILELFYGTGIRADECYGLDVDAVDLEISRLVVRGKGGKDRAMPLGPNLRQHLRRYLSARESFEPAPGEKALFVSRTTHRRLSYASLGIIVREAARAIGLKGFGPHTLRHAWYKVVKSIASAILLDFGVWCCCR